MCYFSREKEEADIVGLAPALLERLRGKYHRQILARGPDLYRIMQIPPWPPGFSAGRVLMPMVMVPIFFRKHVFSILSVDRQ